MPDTVFYLDSLIAKLTDCRKLEHGEMVSDEEFAALVRVNDWLKIPENGNGLTEGEADDI